MPRAYALEIPYRDPAALFAAFAGEPYAQFLDSSRQEGQNGRYSYIATDPMITLTEDGLQDNPFDVIQAALAHTPIDLIEGLPPFQGGLVGLFGYDLGRHLEDLPVPPADDFMPPALAVGFYDRIAAFDHQLQKAWVVGGISSRVKAYAEQIMAVPQQAAPGWTDIDLDWQPNFSREGYEAAVRKVIDFILAGDIFQANLSQRFLATVPEALDRYALYCQLRRQNPAPFSAFLNFGDTAIACTSPERFLKVSGRAVETCPIKGTRPRSLDPAEDQRLADELMGSEKDRAENTMIVDLLRNDLSRVCAPDSVEVQALCELQSFEYVHHLVSTVTGRLSDEKGPLDVLQACFPGGSITGAPKIRAMEILNDLEPARRGPWCGAIGYIGFNGTMDTNIVIRSLVFQGNRVAAQAGGGIVADSEPAAEYEETLAKVTALLSSFKSSS